DRGADGGAGAGHRGSTRCAVRTAGPAARRGGRGPLAGGRENGGRGRAREGRCPRGSSGRHVALRRGRGVARRGRRRDDARGPGGRGDRRARNGTAAARRGRLQAARSRGRRPGGGRGRRGSLVRHAGPRLSVRARNLVFAAAALAPLAFWPLVTAGGGAAFAVAFVAAAALLASRSPALPYALWGAPALVFGLLGRNPLANGAVELGLVCFALLALALALVRDPEALPLRLLAAPPVLLAAALAVLIGLRLSASDATRFELRRFLAEGLLFLAGGIAIGRRRRGLDLWALVLAATATASALVVTAGLAFDNDRWSGGALPLYAEGTPRALARDTAPALLAAAYVALSTRHERVRLTAL